MARPRDEQKVAAIFEASLKLVLAEGFSGFKMGQVAKNAGIATGTLYIYFKNKEELINQLFITTKRQSIAALFKGYDEIAPFMESFEQLWFNFLNYNLAKPEEGAFVEQYYRSPYLKTEIVEETERLLVPLFELLEKGKKEGLVMEYPTALLVSQLTGSIHEHVRWCLNGQLILNKKQKQQAFQMAWKSIKK